MKKIKKVLGTNKQTNKKVIKGEMTRPSVKVSRKLGSTSQNLKRKRRETVRDREGGGGLETETEAN